MITIDPKKMGVMKKDLKKFKKQIPFVLMGVINDAAFAARLQAQKDMQRILKGGATKFTKGGVRVQKASKRKLRGRVYFIDNVWKYMRLQVKGGTDNPSGKVHAVPTRRTRLTKLGNVSPGQRAHKLLAKSAGKGKGANKRNTFFSGNPRNSERLGAGVWKRTGAKGREGLEMIHSYTGPTKYRKRYNFYKLTLATIRKGFSKDFQRRWKQALSTARP